MPLPQGKIDLYLSMFFIYVFLSFSITGFVFSEEGYSEKLRKEILEKDEVSLEEIQGKDFSKKRKEELQAQEDEDEELKSKNQNKDYTEELRSKLSEVETSSGYSKELKEKAQADSPEREGSAIQDLHDGNSELELKRPGQIQHASGFRVGARQTRQVIASGRTDLFKQVYKDSWNPDLSLFYEYHPFHWDSLFSLGFGLQLGYTYFGGNGQFKFLLRKSDGSYFDSESEETFRLQVFSASVGPTLRLNVFNYVRPFIKIYPGYAFYEETRTFDRRSVKGKSMTLNINGGIGFLMDWVSRGDTWNMYQNYTIKHYYLTIDFLNVSTLSGKVKFTENSFFGGFTFEF